VRVHVTASVGDVIYPPIVSPAALLFALVLAVFRPWNDATWWQR
jgi:hypothetical protein